ncbi:MAG: FtsQ-type POTRA domain-containing protein [Ruminococcaceae bacterium]|nr:FtsQ-type POTRA domain-containing protein [Oscillospiraceae bacterium]
MNKEKSTATTEYRKKRSPYKTTVSRAKIAGILCLAALAVILFFMSPVFRIRSIDVVGNIELKKAEIIDVSGIKKGDNIFRIDSEKARNAISGLGKVTGIEIIRSLPGDVTIRVYEKTECAYIMEKAAYTGIDETGMIISTMSGLDRNVPLIKGIKLVDTKKGQYIKIDRKDSKVASELIRKILTELKNQEILGKVKYIDLSDLDDIKMTLRNDVLVNMGKDGNEDGDNIEYKIAFLKAIIPEIDSQTGGVVELSDTENVTSSMS